MGIGLLVIGMQMQMAERIASGRQRCNPHAEDHVADLLALFRAKGLPVFHVWHHDTDLSSTYRRGLKGADPMPCALPIEGEEVLWKSGSSGFSRTGLDPAMRRKGVRRVVIVGAVAACCVASTARAGSDLGFDIVLPSDALLAFDLPSHDGGRIDADTTLRVTLATLASDFVRLVSADQVAGLI